LAVSSTSGFGFSPISERFVAFLKLLARQIRVPGGVAAKTPCKLTFAAGYHKVLCSEASKSPWDFMLCQQTAVWTSFVCAVLTFFLLKSKKMLFSAARDVAEYFIYCDYSIIALWVRAHNVDFAIIFDVCTYDFLCTAFADHLRAACPCVCQGVGFSAAHYTF
jgi:hypothetical protein